MDLGLAGKNVVVTGAAQGIGAAVSWTLAGQGARVVALDHNVDQLDKTVGAINDAGRSAIGYQLDVRDSTAVERLIGRVDAEFGPIDVLVNVAGVLRLSCAVDLSDEDWATTFDVNVSGVFHMSRAVGRRMAARGAGAIITVGSNAGSVPRMRMAAYAASKAASAAFTKNLGLELASAGVRCNVVSPGSTDTPMLRGMWTDDSKVRDTLEGSLAAHRIGIPLRKLAEPSDIADAVAFLASDRAGHITMHDLCVDGGAALGA